MSFMLTCRGAYLCVKSLNKSSHDQKANIDAQMRTNENKQSSFTCTNLSIHDSYTLARTAISSNIDQALIDEHTDTHTHTHFTFIDEV